MQTRQEEGGGLGEGGGDFFPGLMLGETVHLE